MKKYFILVLILAFSSAVFPQKKSSKKSKSKVESPKKDKDAIKKISEVTKKSKKIEGLFDLYQDTVNGSIKMVIKQDQIGKEYIYFSQIADGVLDAGSYRGSYRGSKVFKIEKECHRKLNTSYEKRGEWFHSVILWDVEIIIESIVEEHIL